jgi:uncharacterized protein DUF998
MNQKQMNLYILGVTLIFGLLLVVGGSLYYKSFNFRDVCISNLGNPGHNPDGWWLFTIAMIFSAIGLIPVYQAIFKKLEMGKNIFGKIWMSLLYLASFGMVGVGIFNETMGIIHYYFAGFTFGGFGIAALSSVGIYSYRIKINKTWPSLKGFCILFSIMLILIIIILSEVITYGIDVPSDLNFTEWIAFFLIFTWLYGTHILSLSNRN